MSLIQKAHLSLVHSIELNYIYLYMECSGQCGWATKGAQGCEWTNYMCPTKKPIKCYSCEPKDVNKVIYTLDLRKDFKLVETREKIIKDNQGVDIIRPDFVYFKNEETSE